MADNTNTTSSFRFRIACEECHTRKIKCYPSLDDNSEACEACRVNQRKCLFSLKSKLGRPRKMNRNHPTPTNTSKTSRLETTTIQSIMESPPAYSGPDRTSTFSNLTGQENFPDHEELNMQLDQRSTLQRHTSESQKQPDMVEISSNILRARLRTPMERSEELRAQTFQPKQLHRVNGSLDMDYIDSTEFREVYEDGMPSNLSTFSHESLDFSVDDFSHVGLDEFETPMFPDFTTPQAQMQQVDQKPPQRMVEDDQETIQIYSEVFRQGRIISNKRFNMFAETIQEDLQQMISILQRISVKITALFKIPSGNLSGIGNQGIAMIIFACVIQAVENVSKFFELDQEIHFNRNPAHTQSQSLPNLSTESIIPGDGRGGVSNMRLELIMVVTRLDFLLMQFKAFVTNFNSLVTVISISHPSQLITNLHNLHQKFELILEKLRIEWV